MRRRLLSAMVSLAAGVTALLGGAPAAVAQEEPPELRPSAQHAPQPPDGVVPRGDAGAQVVGGTPVPEGTYPFQAALLFEPLGDNDYDRQFCGGSLISPYEVLTAAHCVDNFAPDEEIGDDGRLPLSQLKVAVGRTVLSSDQGQRRGVVGVAVHPDWDPVGSFSPDVAVLALDEPVLDIEPIRLVTPGTDALERPGRTVITSGWGNTIQQPVGPGPGGVELPDQLHAARLPLVSDEECSAAYTLTDDGTSFLEPETMVCAGRTGLDACQGDSGGPLFVASGDGGFLQLGITSWGFGCGATGFPGVWSQLSSETIGNFVLSVTGGIPVTADAPA